MSFFEEFRSTLAQSYPSTFKKFGELAPLSPQMVSPYVVELPAGIKDTITEAISAFWSYTQQRRADVDLSRRELGVCSSFDFHVRDGQAKLIEVNTNASLSLIFSALESHHGFGTPPLDEFVAPFLNEHRLQQDQEDPAIAVVDQNVAEQKMRLEFYLYQELFERAGLRAEVLDLSELKWDESSQKLISEQKEEFNFVYNRHTDFYFEKPESSALLAAYQSGQVTISPNPSNYERIAHKKILCELTGQLDQNSVPLKPEQIAALKKVLLPTYWAKEIDPQELWSRRKEFFFKPAASFGSKGVYRGRSISQKVFQSILSGTYLAQDIFAPGTIPTDSGEMKFDVRAITYGPELQITGARLYTGQLTNFRTLGGGAAAIRWLK